MMMKRSVYVAKKLFEVLFLSLVGFLFFFKFYLQHAPLQIVILHAWKDHLTRFTLNTFPSYFMLIPVAVCVLFGFLDS